jgi:hypothetical protein
VAERGANHRDNIEQVLENNPAAGAWRIRVIGSNVPQGPQTSSICATGLDRPAGIDGAESIAPATPRVRVHPNPFQDEVAIEFDLVPGGPTTVTIHDSAGRRVRRLAASEQSEGTQRLLWDGRDDDGRSVPRGVYFLEVRAGGRAIGEKLIVR